MFQAGTRTIGATVGPRLPQASRGWQAVPFPRPFDGVPLLFSQVQTDNDPSFVNTRHQAPQITQGGFVVAMEQEEANRELHGGEILGFVAFDLPAGNGSASWGSIGIAAGATRRAVRSSNYQLRFPRTFKTPPLFTAQVASYYDSNPCHLRYSSLTSQIAVINIEEDGTYDREKNHYPEIVHYLALEAPGSGSEILEAVPFECFVEPSSKSFVVKGLVSGRPTVFDLVAEGGNSQPEAFVVSLPKLGALFAVDGSDKPTRTLGVGDSVSGRVLYLGFGALGYLDQFQFTAGVGGLRSDPSTVSLAYDRVLPSPTPSPAAATSSAESSAPSSNNNGGLVAVLVISIVINVLVVGAVGFLAWKKRKEFQGYSILPRLNLQEDEEDD
jgi:hypothetical protein